MLCGPGQAHGPLWASVSLSVTREGEPSFAHSGLAHVPEGLQAGAAQGLEPGDYLILAPLGVQTRGPQEVTGMGDSSSAS